MTQSLSLLDLFCGTGAFSEGFRKASRRIEVKGLIDVSDRPLQTAALNHPSSLAIKADIRRLPAKDFANLLKLKTVDIIIGGPPCQGFSSLRPYRSAAEDDPRNNLFIHFAKYVRHFRPSVFVMENVLGLLTFKSGDTTERIQETFHRMGYDTNWRVLNAAHFGVPQKRERFFLIGAERGGVITFPKPSHAFSGKGIGFRDKSRHILSSDSNLPPALTVFDAISDLPPIERGQAAVRYTRVSRNAYQRDRRGKQQELTLHEAANHSDEMMEIIRHTRHHKHLPEHLHRKGFSSSYARLRGDEPSTTLTVKFLSPASSKCIHPTQDRSLTPREGARIQSFDDSFLFSGPKTSIAEQIGNAVPPLLARAIARSIVRLL